jgi:PGDYG protein
MQICQTVDGYSINGKVTRDLWDLPGTVRAMKKPMAIFAHRIDCPFEVQTTEGVMKGQAGDWLMKGVSGELYICPSKIFEKSYDVLEISNGSDGLSG